MQPWGRHRENLWLVWDCSHLTEGKLLNEKFLCLFDRFVTRKRKILLVKYDRMQMRRCSLWIFAWIYWIIVAVWIQIAKKKIPFKASICEQRGWHYEKAALYFIWEMGFSLMWKYCLPHSKCRIPTNIALWIIQTKRHNYPFNMSNLVMILKNLLSDFSEGKCST